MTDKASIEEARDAAIGDFGSVDVVVNNAGYAVTGYFEDMTEEQIRAMYEVNVFGLMAVTRAFLHHFRSKRDGTFVNISSVGGIGSFPSVHLYNSTKFAVEGFSEGTSYEFGELGIRTIIIEPGTIQTDFYGRSQIRVPSEIDDYKAINEKMAKGEMGKSGQQFLPPSVIAELIDEALEDPEKKVRYASIDAQQIIDMRNQVGSEQFIKNMKTMFFGE